MVQREQRTSEREREGLAALFGFRHLPAQHTTKSNRRLSSPFLLVARLFTLRASSTAETKSGRTKDDEESTSTANKASETGFIVESRKVGLAPASLQALVSIRRLPACVYSVEAIVGAEVRPRTPSPAGASLSMAFKSEDKGGGRRSAR